MSRVPSAGWRAVYRWCGVPMTSQREPPLRERGTSGTTQAMSDTQEVRRQMHEYAKRRMRDVSNDLQAAQDEDSLDQLANEIEDAAQELVHVKTELEEVTA